jgi:polar amino acid transport system substrate-binding protein
MRIPLRAALLGACLAWAALPARAQTMYLQENLPYSSAGAKPGFMLEVIEEMAHTLKKDVPIRFMDWPAAQKTVRDGHDGIIFPFTRTPEREANYHWLLKFWDVEDKFVVRAGSPAVDSYDAAAKLPSVGVIGGSAEDGHLKSHAFTNVRRYDNALAVAKAVADGEVSAGYGPLIEVKYAWVSRNLPGKPLFGKTVLVGAHWIATSKDSPAINDDDWRQAFEVVQQEGVFDKLYESYFGARE